MSPVSGSRDSSHAGTIQRVSRKADDHVIANHDWRCGGEKLCFRTGDLLVPALFACRRLQRHQEPVRRLQIQPTAMHAQAPVADVVATACFPEEVPDLFTGLRIDSPCVVRSREVQHTVYQQGR